MKKIMAKNCDMYENETPTIVFLGDSVTNGCFELYKTDDGCIDTRFILDEAYHNKLKNMLNRLYPNVPINIINAGISGDCAAGGCKRLERDVLRFNPDLVVVCYGLNDSQKGVDGLTEYATSLDEIFKKIECECIFMTPNMMATNIDGEIFDADILEIAKTITNIQNSGIMDKYMDTARDSSKKNNVTVCDCYSIWKMLFENGVNITKLLANRLNHPTEEMHNLFAVELLKIILN